MYVLHLRILSGGGGGGGGGQVSQGTLFTATPAYRIAGKFRGFCDFCSVREYLTTRITWKKFGRDNQSHSGQLAS